MDQIQLLAGAAVADITPPLEVGLLTSSVKGLYEPFESVRLPLKARVLVLKSSDELIAVVALDLLAITDTSVGSWAAFKQSLSTIIPAEKIILCCTHTHSAPESGAMTGLYLTESYQTWLLHLQQQIKAAITEAINKIKPCNLSVATSMLNGFSMQRRIKTPAGVIMSDSIQPIAAELLDLPPVDRRVNTLHIQDENGEGIATLVQAVCHPVHEMCIPQVSSEFPGEMCIALEESAQNGVALFLNGAAGDTNPPTVSWGPEYAHQHGAALAETAQKLDGRTAVEINAFKFVHSELQLSARKEAGITNANDAIARLSAICIGTLAIVFLPGEVFIETAFEIERNSPFERTLIAGFGENNIGYLPTAAAFNEGGYEVGPGKWSFLEPGTDQLLAKEAIKLLSELYHK